MQPIRKKLVSAMDWQQEPIGKKLALEFFVKLFMQLHWFICVFSFFILYTLRQLALKRLALVNHSYFN